MIENILNELIIIYIIKFFLFFLSISFFFIWYYLSKSYITKKFNDYLKWLASDF